MGRHTLIQCSQGVGGGVGVGGDQLTSLHEALKTELEGVIGRFRSALKRMDVLSLTHGRPKERSVAKGPPPSAGSHQRLLQVITGECGGSGGSSGRGSGEGSSVGSGVGRDSKYTMLHSIFNFLYAT